MNTVCEPVPSNRSTADAPPDKAPFAISNHLFAARSAAKVAAAVCATSAKYVAALKVTMSPTAYTVAVAHAPRGTYSPWLIMASVAADKLSGVTAWLASAPSSR